MPLVTHARLLEHGPGLLETPVAVLGESWVTPVSRFFVRDHHPAPRLDPASWSLQITGLVGRPLALDLAALRRAPWVQVAHTLECAGNGRALDPLAPEGVPWEHGAVGTAIWGGVRLGDLLRSAEVRPEAAHVWFEPASAGGPPQGPFVRSLPIAKAMDDVLLAYSMNGEALTLAHGAPLRLVVPGWYGMAWIKWLRTIRLESRPCEGHFMTSAYVYRYPSGGGLLGSPVDEMRVKSLIMHPLAGSRVRGMIQVRGLAWAGPAGLREVNVSADGGHTWKPARLAGLRQSMAWREWETDLVLRRPGRVCLAARATDGRGATQPRHARHNVGGYGNNSIHEVPIEVV